MAGELCGTACGCCGRCERQWDDELITRAEADDIRDAAGIQATEEDEDWADRPVFCLYCSRDGCGGDCPQYYEAMEAWMDDQAYEAWRDREDAA